MQANRKILAGVGVALCLAMAPSQTTALTKREPHMTVYTLKHYCTELLKSSYSIDYNPQYVENVTGYMTGFFDTAHYFLSPRSADFCAPEAMSIRDACTVFNAWMVRHEDDENILYASPALVRALKEVYPCRG